MQRTQVQLDADTYAAVRQRAFDTRRSISAVVRDTLAAALNVRPTQAAAIEDFRFVGSGRSSQRPGRPVSAHHDEALADAYASRPRRRR
jgi:hypothetical protein